MSKNLTSSKDINIVTNGNDISLEFNDSYYNQNEIDNKLLGKVGVESGKGLSTNDFTNILKTKLNDIEEKAQKNVIETIKVGGKALTPNDKEVNIDLSGIKTNSDNIVKNTKAIKGNATRISRLEKDIFDSGTAKGSSIHIEDSTMSEFQEMVINGVCKQETTAGKNHYVNAENLKFSTVSKVGSAENLATYDGYNNVIHIKEAVGYCTLQNNSMSNIFTNSMQAKDSITVLVLIKKEENVNVNLFYNDYAGEGYKNLVKYKDLTSNWAYYYATYTFGNNVTKFNPKFHFKTNGEVYIAKIQVEISSTPTDFEPYTGGQPSPSPDYPQEIEVIEGSFNLISCRKNLAKVSKEEVIINDITIKNVDNKITLKGTSRVDSTLSLLGNSIYRTGNYYENSKMNNDNTVAINKKGKIIIQYESNYGNVRCFKGKLGQIVSTSTRLYPGTVYEVDVGDRIWVGIYMDANQKIDNYINNLQIEFDNKTSFEPYQETLLTLTIPEEEFIGKINDSAKDRIVLKYNEEDERNHAYLERNIAKVIFNGSEDWQYYGQYKNNQYLYYLEDTFNGKTTSADNGIGVGCSTHFKWAASSDGLEMYECVRFQMWKSNRLYFGFINDFTNGVTDLKAWLKQQYDNGTPVIIYYALSNPYTIDLGVIDMPLSYYPVTNVYTTSDLQPEIEVLYYRDIKGTINNMQNDIETLKQQVSQLMTTPSTLSLEPEIAEPNIVEAEYTETENPEVIESEEQNDIPQEQ